MHDFMEDASIEGLTADEVRARALRMMLAELQRSYHEAAKPIVDELVDIEARKPPRPVIIPLDPGQVPPYIRDMIKDTERQIRDTCFGSVLSLPEAK
jgi:hypothetical protein